MDDTPDPSLSAGDGDPSLPGRCGRNTKRGPCKAWPVRGATVCVAHGGKAPQVKAAAVRRLERQVAEQAMTTYGLPREIDPADALLEEVHRTAGHVAWLQVKVAGLDEDDLVWGTTQEVDKGSGQFGGTDTTSAAKPHVLVQLYREERKHLAEVCRAALAAGVAERQIRLAEQQGAMLAGVIGRVLDALELTVEQRQRVSEVVPRELRAASARIA